jgi:UDP-2-acetamido-2,6-beta-L-arabino-hexul-4-ose reductase
MMIDMRILITGSRGFIGKNLVTRLTELGSFQVLEFARHDPQEKLAELLQHSDAVVHLAGENRPQNPDEFARVNVGLTQALCQAIRDTRRSIPLILASSTQAELDNPYGRSKLDAERSVKQLAADTGIPCVIYRLPGVFGKWCRPNYNSVVATFCHNIANDLPIQINDPETEIRLVHIDDIVNDFLGALRKVGAGVEMRQVVPEYKITLGALASQIQAFKDSRGSLMSERVGTGLVRALYATYVSYLPANRFAYEIPKYGDDRGVFVEMLKTPDCGQFSYFTARPGVTRGGHYHHSKTEKFLVVKGTARFGFRNIQSNATYELRTSGDRPQIVETVPGWTHDITNVGEDEMVVLLWANEVFDRDRPDTIPCKV